ncbi:DUF4280 domain-containing protein [Clostridium sp.]|uniref:DUF4280 domain-containing protein n=1 Tax=Clostridium sp. TaxID=1506 RepID=UPI00262757F0|nr:DUF4280 domain-containing protein [Clostridium sp.]
MADGICYIARGAKMRCSKGSGVVMINLPKSHGTYINGKPIMIKTDRVVGTNIGNFGTCGRNPCTVTIFGDWMNCKEDTIVKDQPVLTDQSVLICAYGGQIRFVTDGQYD